jgi:hypothetical protein
MLKHGGLEGVCRELWEIFATELGGIINEVVGMLRERYLK